MDIAGIIGKLAGIDPVAILDKGAQIADRFIQTDEEKQAFQIELMKLKASEQTEALQSKMEAEKAAYADTASARGIRGIGELVQAGLAFLFTVSFFTLIIFILFWMKEAKLLPEQENIIFLVFGAVSGIMVTIVGFYFGSSAGSKGKDEIINKLQSVSTSKE